MADESTNPASQGVEGPLSLDEAFDHLPEGSEDDEEGGNAAVEGDDAPDTEQPDDDADDASDEDSGEPTDETEEVEYQGSKYRIPKALKPAIMKDADYTQKTQEAAETMRVAREFRQAAEQERQLYATHFSQMAQQLSVSLNQLPTEEQLAQLARPDTMDQYIQARAQRDLVLSQMHQVNAAQQQLSHQHAQAAEQEHRETVRTEWGKLFAKVPEWKEQKKLQAEFPKVVQFMQEHIGLSQDEANQVLDHRYFVAARELMLLRQMITNKGADKRVPNAKQMPKPTLRPGTQPTNPNRRVPTDLRKRFTRSGSLDDAAAILNMME